MTVAAEFSAKIISAKKIPSKNFPPKKLSIENYFFVNFTSSDMLQSMVDFIIEYALYILDRVRVRVGFANNGGERRLELEFYCFG